MHQSPSISYRASLLLLAPPSSSLSFLPRAPPHRSALPRRGLLGFRQSSAAMATPPKLQQNPSAPAAAAFFSSSPPPSAASSGHGAYLPRPGLASSTTARASKLPCRRPHRLAGLSPPNPFSYKPVIGVEEERGGARAGACGGEEHGEIGD